MYVSAQAENELALPLPFCSSPALSGLTDACPHPWGWSFLLSL